MSKTIFLRKHFKSVLFSRMKLYCIKDFSTIKKFSEKEKDNEVETREKFKLLMTKVPQPVVVVTSAIEKYNDLVKRGITCSSFTSVSLKPQIVSFCMSRESRMHNLLLRTKRFAVHILANDQVSHGIHFSKYTIDGEDQFINIEHDMNNQNLPIIKDTTAVIVCKYYSVTTIGDHHVWYGLVEDSLINPMFKDPLLYYSRNFHSVGDEAFMQAFENTSLPFKDWTHQGHLRMAWNYILKYGIVQATPLIKNGIKRYNEQNKDKIQRGYNETVTCLYIHLVADAINRCKERNLTFEEFLSLNSHLTSSNLPFKYYSKKLLQTKECANSFVPPNLDDLPNVCGKKN